MDSGHTRVATHPSPSSKCLKSAFSGSTNYADGFANIDLGQGLDVTRAEREVAHLALDASEIGPIAAGHYAILEDFVENGVMKCPLLPRGE
jgi:hypothetical protein